MAAEDATIARKGVRTLVFRIATAASDTLMVVVTARGLGAHGRALYALASFTGAVIVSLIGGTATALAAEYAHGRAEVGRLYAASVTVCLLGGTVIGLGLGVATAVTWPHAEVLLFPAVIAPFFILNVLQINMYMSQGDVRRMSYVTLATSAVPLLGVTAMVLLHPDRAYVALSAWAVAQAVVALATLWVQRRQARFEWHALRPLIRRLLTRGTPVSLANGIQLLNYRVDLLVVTALLPLAAVGRYSVAIAMGESLLIVSRSLVSGAFQRVIKSATEQSMELLVRVIRHVFFLLLAGAVVLLALAKMLLEPVFGHQFVGVWTPLALLIPGVIALGTSESLRLFFLIRLERSREYLIAASSAMLVNLVVAILLVPPLGLAGAAISTTLSYSASAVYLLRRFVAAGAPRTLRAYLPRRADVEDYRRLLASLPWFGRASGRTL